MAKKIAVVAANGRVAGKVIAEAVSRGFDVTGFGRKENNTKAQHYVQKDLFELTKEDLQGFDAVVDAAGAWTLDTMYVIPKAAIYLLQPTFPDSYKPVSAAHGLALAELRASEDVKWTYISPAGDFQADGERTGKYILAGEELTLNSRNESIISYADYALAMVDEIEKGNHIQQRISVVRA